MATYSKEEAIAKFGEEIVEKAMESNAECTNNVCDYFRPGYSQFAGEPVKVNEDTTLTAYYYVPEDFDDELENFDWEDNVEFEEE